MTVSTALPGSNCNAKNTVGNGWMTCRPPGLIFLQFPHSGFNLNMHSKKNPTRQPLPNVFLFFSFETPELFGETTKPSAQRFTAVTANSHIMPHNHSLQSLPKVLSNLLSSLHSDYLSRLMVQGVQIPQQIQSIITPNTTKFVL
jgi:hypothetical protein